MICCSADGLMSEGTFKKKKKKTADRPLNKHSCTAYNLSRVNINADTDSLKCMRTRREYKHMYQNIGSQRCFVKVCKQNVSLNYDLNYMSIDPRCVSFQ